MTDKIKYPREIALAVAGRQDFDGNVARAFSEGSSVKRA
jgi:hypothetical protein